MIVEVLAAVLAPELKGVVHWFVHARRWRGPRCTVLRMPHAPARIHFDALAAWLY